MRVRLKLERLHQLLAESRLSQNHWALKLGLSRGHWSEIVNGKHPYPSAKTRERMLEIFGLPLAELFEIEAGLEPGAELDFRRAISDCYLIDSELGQGGMGAVYLGRDVRHGRTIAVKVISPEAVSGIGVTQFLREIATVAKLQHPHILPLFDSGDAAGQPFYVMPYIRGGSLRARLEQAVRLPVEETVALVRGIAGALQHAHAQRVLHCDVKPENILLDQGHPWVMDFGIARTIHSEVLPWTARRELDLSAGTPAYVSPEQASGEQQLDAGSDVYSLGCVVYEMLTGRKPFEGTNTQAIVARRFIEPAPPIREFAPEVPAAVEQAVTRAMALEPARRFPSAREFAATLESCAQGTSSLLARSSVTLTRAVNWTRRRTRRGAVRLGNTTLGDIMADFRYALRSLRQSRAFSLIVVITLALGIGANTAIFSVVRGVLLKPLPHRDGDRLMYLRHSIDGTGGENINFSVPEVRDLRTGAPAFGGLAEYSGFSMIYQGEASAERIGVGLVTGNYFEVMGLSPVLGRLTRPSDDGPGVPPVVVLTHQYWMKRFGGDSRIVGRRISLDKKSVEVIGVLQPAPFFPDRIDVLGNMVNSEHHLGASMVQGRSHRMTEVVARLAPGASLAQARNEVATVSGRVQEEFKDAYDPRAHHRYAVIAFKDALGDRARLTLWLLMAAAGFVLIISAANVANLTLMRGVKRSHELVVRAALGAGVTRLRRLLLAENLLLAFTGAAVGLLIAIGGVKLLTSLAERYSPRASEIRLDDTVLGFTVALSAAVALLLSFLASLPREGGLAFRILAGSQRMSGSASRQRLQRGLVVVQVAVSVVLLAGAGLLTRTMLRLSDVDTGLVTEEVLTMRVNLLTRAERADPAVAALATARFQQMRDEIAALPGVVSVGTGTAPLRTTDMVRDVKAEGRPIAPGEAMPRAELRGADPEYFSAAGIPLLAGRVFSTTDPGGVVSGDRAISGSAVVINRLLADRLFPGEDPLGKRIAWTNGVEPVFGEWCTIVGVVGTTRDGGLDAEPRGAVFLQNFGGALVIRTVRNVASLTAAATGIVHRIAPLALLENVLTVAQIKDESVAPRRLNAALVSSFSLLALLIAAVGIAGVLAFSVSARTNEIGIRMSLGADQGRVQRMIMREGGVLVVVGLGLGVTGAFFAARVIQGLLFGIAPHDPITFVAVAVMMATIGILACWIPALRAARIDPAVAMRSE